MGKFKVGDKVRVKKVDDIKSIMYEKYENTLGVFVCGMNKYCNKNAIVMNCYDSDHVSLDVDNELYSWNVDLLDFADEGEKTGMRVKIEDVKIVVPNKVVEVTFCDGTKEKAVCAEEDTYNLDTAITICIAKHVLGGSSAYNNAVRKANKILVNKAKAVEKAKAEVEQKKKRVAKFEAYKKRKAEKKREQEIELRKEAYKRAIMELEDEKAATSFQ